MNRFFMNLYHNYIKFINFPCDGEEFIKVQREIKGVIAGRNTHTQNELKLLRMRINLQINFVMLNSMNYKTHLNFITMKILDYVYTANEFITSILKMFDHIEATNISLTSIDNC